jgi:small GTP-binding protein
MRLSKKKPEVKSMINTMTRTPIFKTVIIGEGGVGKTSITLRYTEDRFDENMMITIGANFASKKVEFNGSSLTLMIWDLGGQPRFRDVVADYFRGSKAAIVVYDATRSYSLSRLTEWVDRLKETAPDCDILFVGNKTDAREIGSGVSYEEGLEFAQNYDAHCIEVSAKSGEGISEMFELVAQRLMKRYYDQR